jgi:hypothetical protein
MARRLMVSPGPATERLGGRSLVVGWCWVERPLPPLLPGCLRTAMSFDPTAGMY